MPNTASSSHSVMPSMTGSMPVKDVLQRIAIRDPNRKYVPGYSRRQEDLELHWRLSPSLTWSMAVLVAVGLLWVQLRKPVRETIAPASFAPLALPGAGTPQLPRTIHSAPPAIKQPLKTEVPLSVPRDIHIAPPVQQGQPQTQMTPAPEVPAPENLRVSFIEPRTLEIRWTTLGDDYEYLLYSADNQAFVNAEPIIDQPIISTHAVWTPDTKVQWVWVAVKGIDAKGHSSPLSRPVLVQLAPIY